MRPAGDGDLALRSIEAESASLILLDIQLPGIDGFEVCRRLKNSEEYRDIPVLFISAYSDEIVCVILDLTIPHMDGTEAISERRTQRESEAGDFTIRALL